MVPVFNNIVLNFLHTYSFGLTAEAEGPGELESLDMPDTRDLVS